MKQLAGVIIGLAVLCLTFSGFADNKPTSFAGTWICDPEKSDAFTETSRITNLGPMVIEQNENEIRITKTEMGKQIVDSYKLDGKAVTQVEQQIVGIRGGLLRLQMRIGPVSKTTLAKLSKSTFEIKEVAAASSGKRTVKTAFTLSKDGKVLTMKITTSVPRPGRDSESIATSQKLVFNKKAGNT